MNLSDLPPDVINNVRKMLDLGWTLSKVHGDGVADVTCIYGQEWISCFIDENGIHRPRSHWTMVAESHLHEAGIELVPAKPKRERS